MESEVLTRVSASAWRAWIRKKGCFSTPPADARPGELALGAAVFSFPEPREAKTTSWFASQGLICVFTGYLYNHPDLAQALGCDPTTATPAELLLTGYQRWRQNLLLELEGAYTWAIWDQAADTLLCARDPIGLHPLYYSETRDGLVVSWDLETVRRHPLVSRDLDPVVLAEHVTHHLLDARETFFRAIRRVPGGHALRMVSGCPEVFRYWNPLPLDQTVRWITPEELPMFPTLFQRAVEGVMRCGNGRTGMLLSGGLDSVAIASYAADIARARGWPPPHAFSVDFPGRQSERPTQASVAATLRFPQTFNSVADFFAGPGLLRRVLELAEHYPSPPTFIYAPVYMELIRQAGACGCGVVLTGDGGDELLTVTPAYVADLIRTGRWKEIPRELTTLIRCWDGAWWTAWRTALWTWGLRALLRDWAWRRAPGLALRRRQQLLPKAYPHWIAPDPALRKQLISRFEERWDRASISKSAYLLRANEHLTNPGMNIVFEEQFYRYTMTGVPALHPFWSLKFADFLLRVPPAVLNAGGWSKSLVRHSLAERFPHLGFHKQKKDTGDDLPNQVLRRELPPLWRDLGRPLLMMELGIIDATRYETALHRFMASRVTSQLYEAWHGSTIEQWIRYHY